MKDVSVRIQQEGKVGQVELDPKPSATAGKTVFAYTGVGRGIPVDNAPNILNKDYTITAQITVPEGGTGSSPPVEIDFP